MKEILTEEKVIKNSAKFNNDGAKYKTFLFNPKSPFQIKKKLYYSILRNILIHLFI